MERSLAISEIDLSMEGKIGRKLVDMSLRLWSEDYPLGAIADRMGGTLDHLHVRGQPIQTGNDKTSRIAARHYASFSSVKADQASDVSAWLKQLIATLEPHRDIVGLIKDGTIEALAWIAVFDQKAYPFIDDNILMMFRDHNVRVMLESYDNFDDQGAPLREFVV
jgi:hypothetical protein